MLIIEEDDENICCLGIPAHLWHQDYKTLYSALAVLVVLIVFIPHTALECHTVLEFPQVHMWQYAPCSQWRGYWRSNCWRGRKGRNRWGDGGRGGGLNLSDGRILCCRCLCLVLVAYLHFVGIDFASLGYFRPFWWHFGMSLGLEVSTKPF